MKKRSDLTGRQFGSFVVIGKADTNQKGRYWNVECSCGKTIVIEQSVLKNRRITDCGHTNEQDVKSVQASKPKAKKATPNKVVTADASEKSYVGVKEVQLKSGTRYKASISVQGKTKHLGTFDTFEEAVTARKEAEETYR